jgi:hypothetical protein
VKPKLAPIAVIGETGFVGTVRPSVPSSIKELIACDRLNPVKLNFGSGWTGGATHLIAGAAGEIKPRPWHCSDCSETLEISS